MSKEIAFAVFKKFNDLDLAKAYAAILDEHGIDHRVGDNSPALDLTFSGSTALDQTELFVRQDQFEKAHAVLEDIAPSLEDLPEDHYLHKFNNDELYEILAKPDEWSEPDHVLAQKILEARGRNIDKEFLQSLKKHRIDDLSKPETGQKASVIIGYVFSFAGGLIGILIGWYLWSMKKTLPDGSKVPMYEKVDRDHGRIIFFVGIVFIVVWTVVGLLVDQ